MGKINSRDKGKRGEREVAKLLRDAGYTEARRGQQYNGSDGSADVVGLPGAHIEVKWAENLNLDKAMEQSINDANENEIPLVVHKKNRKPWKVTMLWTDFIKIWRK